MGAGRGGLAKRPDRVDVEIDLGTGDELGPVLARTLRGWQFADGPIAEALKASTRLLDVAVGAMAESGQRDMVHVEVTRFGPRVFVCVTGDGMNAVRAAELETIPEPRGTHVHHDDAFRVARRGVWCAVADYGASPWFGRAL